MNANSVRRLIALIAGVSFFAFGIYLLMQGISATGRLDIQSSLLSGKDRGESAGLFIALLSTVIIVFAVASGEDSKRVPRLRTFYIAPVTRRLAWVLASLILVAVAAALAIPASGPENSLQWVLKGALIAVGFASAIIFVALLFTIFDWDEDDETELDRSSPGR